MSEQEMIIEKYIKEGSKYIYPEKMEKWKEWVTTRVEDPLDKGLSIKTSLEIMEKLANGTSLDDTLSEYHNLVENLSEKEKFDQKDYALSFVGNIMFNFGDVHNGVEFYKKDAIHSWGPQFLDNEKVQQNIERQDEMNKIMAASQKEKVTIENQDAKTAKDDFSTLSRENLIENFIKEGSKYIYPEKMEKWKEWVTTRVEDPLDKGLSIKTSLEIMEKLANGTSLDDTLSEYHNLVENLSEKEKFDQKDYALSFVGNIMFNFGDVHNGVEFYKKDAIHSWGPQFLDNEKVQQDIERQDEMNKIMAAAHEQDVSTAEKDVSYGRGK